MKAFTFKKYGDSSVLQLANLPKPIPSPNQVLVKVMATSVTAGDWRVRSGKPFAIRLFAGVLKPKNPILGHEFSGIVEEVGSEVENWKVGEKVFGSLGLKSGAYADYVLLDKEMPVAKMPENLNFEEASVIPVGFLTAMDFLKKVEIKSPMKVLIHGVSGSVGSAFLQLLKIKGAEVTGVCSSKNSNWVKKLGADHVLCYDQEDYTVIDTKFDLIINTVGKISFQESEHLLNANGVYLAVDAPLSDYWESLKSNMGKSPKKVILGVSNPNQEDMDEIAILASEDRIKAHVDRIYAFEELHAAHSYVQTGRKAGNVSVQVNSSDLLLSQPFSDSAQ